MVRELKGHTSSVPVLPLAAGALTLLLVLPVLGSAIDVWSSDPELSFGALLVPTGVWLAWRARSNQASDASLGHGEVSGALAVAVAAGLYLVCERLSARSPAACAAGLLVWAEVLYLWGWRAARLNAFPIGLATLGLAVQPTLIAPLAFWLQNETAVGAASVTRALGVPIVREGLILKTEAFAFVIADTCSGMNSLLALLAVAGVWTYAVTGSLAGRAIVLGAVLPLVIAANTFRVVLVLLVADGLGQDAAIGFFHTGSSVALFGAALVGLFCVSRVAGCRVLATV